MRLESPKVRDFRAAVEQSRERASEWAVASLAANNDIASVIKQAQTMFVEDLRLSFKAFSIPDTFWVEDVVIHALSVKDNKRVDALLYQWSQKVLHEPTQWLRSQYEDNLA